MKCLVAVKRVIAPYAPIRINSDHSGVVTNNLTMSMNPFDEIAIEQAKILKEQGLCSEIIVVSIGSIDFSDTLREALARGADKAILVKTEAKYSSLNIAKILKWLVLREQPDLVLSTPATKSSASIFSSILSRTISLDKNVAALINATSEILLLQIINTAIYL